MEPRYIVWLTTRFYLCDTLAEACDRASEFGGRIYEPLAATAAERIYAAPDLLAALKNLMEIQDSTYDCWCDDEVKPCEACAGRAAIAKAEGKPSTPSETR